MNKNNKIILIILISLIALGLGYWFIYRPYAIKRFCLKQVKNYDDLKEKERDYGLSYDEINDYYYLCLKVKNL
jgi:Tfp pilus assembly protein PilO